MTAIKPLSPAEDARRRELHAQGLPDSAIAAQVGCTRDGVRSWRRRCGLPSNRPAAPRVALDIRPFYDRGLTDNAIAYVLKCDKKSVCNWRAKHRLRPNAKVRAEAYNAEYISLDIGLADLSLHAMVPDPSMSSWLEEMGATVW